MSTFRCSLPWKFSLGRVRILGFLRLCVDIFSRAVEREGKGNKILLLTCTIRLRSILFSFSLKCYGSWVNEHGHACDRRFLFAMIYPKKNNSICNNHKGSFLWVLLHDFAFLFLCPCNHGPCKPRQTTFLVRRWVPGPCALSKGKNCWLFLT